MDDSVAREFATKHLDRILGFFARVEAKASFLFAMDTGLLALLALNVRVGDAQIWYLVAPAALSLVLLLASLYFVYRCTFPHLTGGSASLIYFREIARRTEAKFIEEFLVQEESSHTRDLLGQVWRNSEILKLKFEAMKIAFVLTAVALIPWTIFLVAAALVHSPGLVLK
jgi:pycsar effector protein